MPFLWSQRRFTRKRPAKVVAAEKRAHVREVRAYARGEKRLEASSPTMIRKYREHPGQRHVYFPPDVAAQEMKKRTDWFHGRVNDKYAGVYRNRMWSLQVANVGRDKRTGRFIKKRRTR